MISSTMTKKYTNEENKCFWLSCIATHRHSSWQNVNGPDVIYQRKNQKIENRRIYLSCSLSSFIIYHEYELTGTINQVTISYDDDDDDDERCRKNNKKNADLYVLLGNVSIKINSRMYTSFWQIFKGKKISLLNC